MNQKGFLPQSRIEIEKLFGDYQLYGDLLDECKGYGFIKSVRVVREGSFVKHISTELASITVAGVDYVWKYEC